MIHSLKLPKGTCDVVKLFSALLVITSHMGSTAMGPEYGSSHWSFILMATQSGYTGVAIFFFLSGFGLMESEKKTHLSFGKFLQHRFLKIYYPVVLVSAIWYFAPPPNNAF